MNSNEAPKVQPPDQITTEQLAQLRSAAIRWLRTSWYDLSDNEPTMTEDCEAQQALRDALPPEWVDAAKAEFDAAAATFGGAE